MAGEDVTAEVATDDGMPDDAALIERAWHAEVALLSPAVRGDRAALLAMLADEFFEVGQSGRRWRRGEIIEALLGEQVQAETPTVSERTALCPAPGLVLLNYRLTFDGRVSRRSALWRNEAGSVRCLFHQGTTVPTT